VAEAMWKSLTDCVSGKVRDSVHLCDYPLGVKSRIDTTLSERMSVLQEIASLGRSARMDAKLKVRQPLASVEVCLADDTHVEWLKQHDEIIRQELNVKEISYVSGNSPFIEYQVLPNFKKFGPKVGKQIPALKKALGAADGATLLAELQADGKIALNLDGNEISLDGEDIEVRLKAKSGWTASQGRHSVVVLSTDLTPELIREGYARDLVRFVQDTRKQEDLQFTDRIHVYLQAEDAELLTAIEENKAYVLGETLGVELRLNVEQPAGVTMQEFEIAGKTLKLGIEVVSQ